MDEMLIHTFRNTKVEDLCLFGLDKSQYLKFISQGRKLTCAKRPGVEQFLLEMSKHFILIPWTAGTEEYATPILDWLDPDGSLFKFRLFRHHCVTNDGGKSYVKDLKTLNVSLSRVLILDNNPRSYQNQQDNGVPIINFEGDQLDCELRSGSYIEVLTQASKFADVRKAITADLRLMVETKRTEVVSIHLNAFWVISFS
jgi:Dullard-like phosphatase family protein